MEGTRQPRRPRRVTRWIAFGTLGLLVAGIVTAVRSRRHDSGQTPMVATDSREDSLVVEGGPRHGVVVTPQDEKSRWVDEIPRLDVSDLDPNRREIFLAAANTQRCTCGCGYTLAGCRVYDATCPKSGPRVAALLDSVRHGHLRSAEGLRQPPPRAD